ncbi:hypothetical protein [Streptacidiphilus sp. EB103A]|uniref:hypothetical protein n=1 Tax=Streptacidiphilus sp. EB103A TaxID=3156275 RepID=UPI0035178F11
MLCLLALLALSNALVLRDRSRLVNAVMAGVMGMLMFTGQLQVLALWFARTVDNVFTSTPQPAPAPKPPEQHSSTPGLPWHDLMWPAVTIGGVAVLATVTATAFGVVRGRSERRAAQAERWLLLTQEHDRIREEYGTYLADPLAYLDRPTLGDTSVPETVAFLHALDAAQDARRSRDDLAGYRIAISVLKTASRTADETARRVGLNHLPQRERSVVRQARKILAQALNSGATEQERRSAYAKACKMLEGIVVLPREARAALESASRPGLSAAARDQVNVDRA